MTTTGSATFGGNVGIGTATPNAKIEIASTINPSLSLNAKSVGKQTQWLNYDNDVLVWFSGINYNNAGDGNFYVKRSSGTGNFIIAPDGLGNVGIGATGPGVKLDVNGAAGSPATTGSTQSGILRVWSVTGGGNGLDMGVLASSPYSSWIQSGFINDYALHAYYPISLNPLGGNVGIGTNAPKDKLDVRGNIMTTGGIMENLYFDGTWKATQAGYGGYISFEKTDGMQYFWSTTASVSADSVQTMRANMVISGTGNVGIGTTNPTELLTLGGADVTNSSKKIQYNAGTRNGASLEFVTEEGGANFDSGIKFNVVNNNSIVPLMYLEGTNGGKVGIGTSTPSAKLHLYNPSSGGATKGLLIDANVSGGSVPFDVGWDDAGVHKSFMMINDSGNVGIGTTNPSVPLHVNPESAVTTTLAKGTGMFQVGNDSVGGALNVAIDYQSIQARTGGGSSSALLLNPNGGNVGIGTTSPGQKLEVNGAVKIIGGATLFSTSGGPTYSASPYDCHTACSNGKPSGVGYASCVTAHIHNLTNGSVACTDTGSNKWCLCVGF